MMREREDARGGGDGAGDEREIERGARLGEEAEAGDDEQARQHPRGRRRLRDRAPADAADRQAAEDDVDDTEGSGGTHRVQYTLRMKLCPLVLLLTSLLAAAPACNEADDDIRANVTLLCNHEGALAMAA